MTIFGFVEWAICPAVVRGCDRRAVGETRDFWLTGAGGRAQKKSCPEEQLFPPMTRTAKMQGLESPSPALPHHNNLYVRFCQGFFQGATPEKSSPCGGLALHAAAEAPRGQGCRIAAAVGFTLDALEVLLFPNLERRNSTAPLAALRPPWPPGGAKGRGGLRGEAHGIGRQRRRQWPQATEKNPRGGALCALGRRQAAQSPNTPGGAEAEKAGPGGAQPPFGRLGGWPCPAAAGGPAR